MRQIIYTTILFLMFSFPSFSQNSQTLDQKITDLSSKIAKELEINKKKTIAVIDFTDLKFNPNDLGRYVADEINSKLFLMKKFKVIERTKINKAISEKKLNFEGGIDEKNAQQLQMLFGVDAIVSGTLSDLGKNVKTKVLIFNSQNAELVTFKETSFEKDEQVASLLGVPAQIPNEENTATLPTRTTLVKRNFIEAKDFENLNIKLWKCFRENNSIVCELEITNNGNKRRFGIDSAGSQIFDDGGKVFKGTFVKFPQAQGENPRIDLINGATVKVTLAFGGASELKTIKQLEIDLYGIIKNVIFLDVPVS